MSAATLQDSVCDPEAGVRVSPVRTGLGPAPVVVSNRPGCSDPVDLLDATDNSAGCAVAMEAVRIPQAAGLLPRHTIRIGLWGGEEEGLLGSRAYVTEHLACGPSPPGDMDRTSEDPGSSIRPTRHGACGSFRHAPLQGSRAGSLDWSSASRRVPDPACNGGSAASSTPKLLSFT